MVQLSLAPARNEKLFSRNYLEDRLPNSEEWSGSEEDARDAWDELKRIYSKEKNDLPERKNDEEGLRHKFISPILEQVLDYSIEKEKTAFGQSSPDYALYENDGKRSNALGSEDEYSNSVGLLEAKAWEKKLEMKKKGGGQLYDRLNPTVQVMEYLYNSEPRWAILTNGKRWRLFNQEASSKMDTYYEVDIITILENNDFKQFKYFYLLFRKQALKRGKGDAFVDRVREESNKYARDVGEDLEDNLYQALLWLTKGISSVNNNDIDPEKELDKLQNESLIFLYRLVFLFYVDSREIMPDPAEQGEDLYSFPSLVDEILGDIDNEEVSEVQTSYFNKLQEIFKMVKKGSEAQGIDREKLFVPAYNGKLFSSQEHKFLKENTIRDEYIAKVIELLARDDDDRRIDYSDLSVRHLGGIYEGLLEYELNYASEPKVLEEGKYEKLSELDKDRESFNEDDIVDEELYLATDDEERKATGSYYTPDYIVEYIVENTVGPKVEERIEEAKEEADNKPVRDQLVQEKVLDLNILDPAMGSGHFLVEVIDHIASEILEYTEKDIQGVKRDVARRCIYGVDINNMATELAKVSIWLNTISSEKPLSFLDHRIKTGNSLIGADIHEIDRHPEEDEDSERQITIGEEFGEENAGVVRANVQKMLEKFKEIQEKEEESPEDIKKQEELYEEFLDFSFRKRFDVLADVYLSHYFDNNYKVDDYNRLLQAFKLSEQKEEGDEEWNQVIKEDWVQKATNSLDNSYEEDNASNQKGFFHWKLEFPEVFFDIEEGVEKQDSGFDAVVGNPPYFNTHTLPQEMRNYLKEDKSWKVYKGGTDIHYTFIERSIDLAEEDGMVSYITSRYWIKADHADELREYILDKKDVERLIDFGSNKIFPDADVHTSIFVLGNNYEESKIWKFDEKVSENEIIDRIKGKPSFSMGLDQYSSEPWVLSNPKRKSLLDKMEQRKELNEYAKARKGMGTGKNPVFILDQEDIDNYDIEESIIENCVRNGDIDKFNIEDRKKLLYTEQVDDIDNYPNAKQYLEDSREALESRKQHDREWYKLRRPQSHKLQDENKSKIFCPYRAKENTFALDEEHSYSITDTTFIVLNDDSDISYTYLEALLNSSLMTFYYKEIGKEKGGVLEYFAEPISKLPIAIGEQEELEKRADNIRHLKQTDFNLNLKDYLVNYSDGKKLQEIYSPVENISESVLSDTKEDRENLKIGRAELREEAGKLVLYATAKYKPEDEEEFDEKEKDQWGYIETEFKPAMNFIVEGDMKDLIGEFLPLAIENEEAGFKKKATQSSSIVERLEEVQLPDLDDIRSGLNKFLDNKEKASKVQNKISSTEHEIHAIVFDLYDLTEEEVETVLDSLDTEEDEKRKILEKFREQRD